MNILPSWKLHLQRVVDWSLWAACCDPDHLCLWSSAIMLSS